jgi:polyhydroxyalkanoate synthase subunit PhaC
MSGTSSSFDIPLLETSAARIYYDYCRNMSDFALRYNFAVFEAAARAGDSAMTLLSSRSSSLQEAQHTMRAAFNSALRKRLNEDSFASSLGVALDSWTEMMDLSGYHHLARSFSDFLSYISRQFEPLRDSVNRTPSEVIEMKGRFHLHHYKSKVARKQKTPILIVYALINRYYILDLLPDHSVISNLLNQGFDIFATDWETPHSYDKDLTLDNYAVEYVGNAVEKIKEITGSEKVSLFGYCWGGIFTLIYAATHPENVKTLILHATPVEITKRESTIMENWTAHVNADRLVDTFGNVPGWMLNLAFIMRNPVETVAKYPRYFSKPRTFDEIIQFFSVETWLYDSRPIIGEVYREIVNQLYKDNLLVRNEMRVGNDVINLANITMPVLNIVGEKDDLVTPQSSKSIINAIGSKDKKLIEFPTGHVGLCISKEAHERLWPEVGKWLAQHI